MMRLPCLIERYPGCQYLVSSRPSGYPAGTLKPIGFTESDLLDFDPGAIAAYACHWCVAVRLARNEPEDEARAEGEADGRQIVTGFRDHPYINDLARSPLMLSAICLVNWFEGGQLPADRAMLYCLCVEGLLHHWDQRRGIHSEYTLDEKLRVCRELAIAMQSDDRAEYEADKVLAIFQAVLGDTARGGALLEHIRYRTGLLIERRPAVFAFAHLTFQEYLAAQAVHEGNSHGITMTSLIYGHADPRWREVIPLFAGSGTDAAARQLIDGLLAAEDSGLRGDLLSDAYLASERGLGKDKALRGHVLDVVAGSTASNWPSGLQKFADEEVASIANAWLGRRAGFSVFQSTGHAYRWLRRHRNAIDTDRLYTRLKEWRNVRDPGLLGELVVLGYNCLQRDKLDILSSDFELFKQPGPVFDDRWHFSGPFFEDRWHYSCQGELALLGLLDRLEYPSGHAELDFSEFPRVALLNAVLAIRTQGPSPEVLRLLWVSRQSLTVLEKESEKRGLAAKKIKEMLKNRDAGDRSQQNLWLSNLIADVQALFEAIDREEQRSSQGTAP